MEFINLEKSNLEKYMLNLNEILIKIKDVEQREIEKLDKLYDLYKTLRTCYFSFSYCIQRLHAVPIQIWNDNFMGENQNLDLNEFVNYLKRIDSFFNKFREVVQSLPTFYFRKNQPGVEQMEHLNNRPDEKMNDSKKYLFPKLQSPVNASLQSLNPVHEMPSDSISTVREGKQTNYNKITSFDNPIKSSTHELTKSTKLIDKSVDVKNYTKKPIIQGRNSPATTHKKVLQNELSEFEDDINLSMKGRDASCKQKYSGINNQNETKSAAIERYSLYQAKFDRQSMDKSRDLIQVGYNLELVLPDSQQLVPSTYDSIFDKDESETLYDFNESRTLKSFITHINENKGNMIHNEFNHLNLSTEDDCSNGSVPDNEFLVAYHPDSPLSYDMTNCKKVNISKYAKEPTISAKLSSDTENTDTEAVFEDVNVKVQSTKSVDNQSPPLEDITCDSIDFRDVDEVLFKTSSYIKGFASEQVNQTILEILNDNNIDLKHEEVITSALSIDNSNDFVLADTNQLSVEKFGIQSVNIDSPSDTYVAYSLDNQNTTLENIATCDSSQLCDKQFDNLDTVEEVSFNTGSSIKDLRCEQLNQSLLKTSNDNNVNLLLEQDIIRVIENLDNSLLRDTSQVSIERARNQSINIDSPSDTNVMYDGHNQNMVLENDASCDSSESCDSQCDAFHTVEKVSLNTGLSIKDFVSVGEKFNQGLLETSNDNTFDLLIEEFITCAIENLDDCVLDTSQLPIERVSQIQNTIIRYGVDNPELEDVTTVDASKSCESSSEEYLDTLLNLNNSTVDEVSFYACSSIKDFACEQVNERLKHTSNNNNIALILEEVIANAIESSKDCALRNISQLGIPLFYKSLREEWKLAMIDNMIDIKFVQAYYENDAIEYCRFISNVADLQDQHLTRFVMVDNEIVGIELL